MLGSDIIFLAHRAPRVRLANSGSLLRSEDYNGKICCHHRPVRKAGFQGKPYSYRCVVNERQPLTRTCLKSVSEAPLRAKRRRESKESHAGLRHYFFWHIEPLESALLPNSGSLLPFATYNWKRDFQVCHHRPVRKARFKRKLYTYRVAFSSPRKVSGRTCLKLVSKASRSIRSKKKIEGIVCWAQTYFLTHTEPLGSHCYQTPVLYCALRTTLLKIGHHRPSCRAGNSNEKEVSAMSWYLLLSAAG